MLGKRLINTTFGGGGTTCVLDILGDGSCIATYQLDGNANDLSGNYSGTPTDVSYGVGEFDLAGVFNGISSVINVDSFVSTSVFAISFWLKAPVPVNWNSLIQSPNTDINSNQINTLFGHIGYFPDGGYGAGYVYVDSSIINVQDNNWHHIVLTCGGTYATTQIYIDGISRTLTGNGSLMQLRGTLNIGQRTNGTDTLNGQLDQVRIFNKALSLAEVGILFNDETPCN